MPDEDEMCTMTELRRGECDHCRHKDKVIVERTPIIRPKAQSDFVVAEFPGACHECGEDIVVGDHIAVVDEVKDGRGNVVRKHWAHYGCTE